MQYDLLIKKTGMWSIMRRHGKDILMSLCRTV